VDQGENNNTNVTLLLNKLFIRLANEPDQQWIFIETQVAEAQQQHETFMKDWQSTTSTRVHQISHGAPTTAVDKGRKNGCTPE
jgi:hypothetical protein